MHIGLNLILVIVLTARCKPVAYHSSHNVYIYYLGSQQVTVDYSAFWCNG